MTSFLNKIRTNLIDIPLLKLAYKFKLFIYKMALKTDFLIFMNLRYRIRILDPNSYTEDNSDEISHEIFLVSYKILKPEIFEEPTQTQALFEDLPEKTKKLYSQIKLEYQARKTNVDTRLDKIVFDKEILKLVNKYYLLHHFKNSYPIEKKELADYYLSKARKYDPTVTPLEIKDLFTFTQSLKKELNEKKKILGFC